MKSLQNQYNLIKEGKGNKEIFLKEVKAQFPQYISNVQTFDQVIHSLTEKGIINEMVLVSANRPETPDWFKVFKENTEAVKADLKDTDKSVTEKETAGYNYEDRKNNNNLSTEEILNGYYAEMKDPKNAEKTEDEIKAIVFKNLEKDPLFYIKNAAFGVKGIGYTENHPGLGPTKEVTGKYKSSGMEPVNLNESLTEAKARRAIEKHIAEIEKMSEVAAWDHRISKIQEKIEELTNKMTVTEGDDVKDMVDKKAVKELKKDIALLTKKKALYEKQKVKAAKKVKDKSMMEELTNKMTVTEGDDVKDMVDKKAVKELKKDIALLTKKKALYEKQKVKAAKKVKDKSMMEDTVLENTPVLEVDATSMPTGAMMLQMADNNPEKFKEYVKQMDADPAFKTQFMKKLSPAEKEELTKKIEAHSEAKTESWSGMVRELITKKRLKLK